MHRINDERPGILVTHCVRLSIAALLVLLMSQSAMQPSFAAVPPGADAFDRTWSRTDLPVASGSVGRTWMWGPGAFTSAMREELVEAPGGRIVQYFDKSRMEITTSPDVDPTSIWYVTNGLLATELITGRLQLGLDSFEQLQPADINLAGDEDDPNAPTYATFGNLLDQSPAGDGTILTQRVDQAGNIVDDPELVQYQVEATEYVPETDHRIAAPFWEFMNSSGLVIEGSSQTTSALFPNPFYATGFPITEAYWATVRVSGEPVDVLIQAFERRVLTYTPGNEPAWQVEAGNVGRHYFRWRYGIEPPNDPPNAPENADSMGPTPLPAIHVNGARATFTVANHSQQPLRIELDGPESRTIELPGCPGCEDGNAPPSSCAPEAPRETLDLPSGTYLLTSTRPGGAAPPMAGHWTLLPDRQYGACFFVIEGS